MFGRVSLPGDRRHGRTSCRSRRRRASGSSWKPCSHPSGINADQLSPAHEVEAIPWITLTGGWETLLEGRERAILERTVLPQFIRRQRWFGGKSRTLETLSIRDWVKLDTPGRDLPTVLLYVRTYDSDGNYEKYQIPMAVVDGELADDDPRQQLGGGDEPRPKAGGAEGSACRCALGADALVARLLHTRSPTPSDHPNPARDPGGPAPTTAFAAPDGQGRAADSTVNRVRRGTSESSNSNVVFDERYWVKLFREVP